MELDKEVGFASPDQTQNFLMKAAASGRQVFSTNAAATDLNGFTIQSDFGPEIEDNLRDNAPTWDLIENKRPAPAPTVKFLRKQNRAMPGFVDRSDLSGAVQNPADVNQNDFSDIGQEVKALAGTIKFSHFERSMADQQGRLYGDEVAEKTEELLTNTFRTMEMSLFDGDATRGSGLEWNGLAKLMPNNPAQIFQIDMTGDQPESIVAKINEMSMRMSTDRNKMLKPNRVICTGATQLAIQNEVGQAVFLQNTREISPGFTVPGIVTNQGLVPIYTTPYLSDLDGGAGPDILRVYLVDWSTICWYGVYPHGGQRDLNPQIFDVTQYVNGNYLIEERMVLVYGTPQAKLAGEGIWRLDIRVPAGSSWNTGGYDTLR